MTTLHDFGGVLGDGLGTLSFGLSQFHGHCSWLVCEVALAYVPHQHRIYLRKGDEDYASRSLIHGFFIKNMDPT